jgi:hypothetical protein
VDKYAPVRLVVDLNHLAFRNWAANDGLATSKGELALGPYGAKEPNNGEQFRRYIVGVRVNRPLSAQRSTRPQGRLQEILPRRARARANFENQIENNRYPRGLGCRCLHRRARADDLTALAQRIFEEPPFSCTGTGFTSGAPGTRQPDVVITAAQLRSPERRRRYYNGGAHGVGPRLL